MLEEITAKGLKPGDPVGDLADPSAATADSQAKAALNARTDKNERGGSGVGMYRAGGPTTIFGGAGWGPYSDGPLNAVRKSLLNRDGLNEENWMYVAAQRTLEAGEEWAHLRKNALKVCGGILEAEQMERRYKRGVEEEEDYEVDERRAKRRKEIDDLPLGVYEPQTGIVLCESSMRRREMRLTLMALFQIARTHNLRGVSGKLYRILQRNDRFLVGRRPEEGHGHWHGWIPSYNYQEVKGIAHKPPWKDMHEFYLLIYIVSGVTGPEQV